MNVLRVAAAIILCTGGVAAKAVTLDTEGGIDRGPIYCSASSWQGYGYESVGDYTVEGTCTVGYFENLPVTASAEYENGEATEYVVIYYDAAKTVKLWEIATEANCSSNPFIGGATCGAKNIWNTSPWPVKQGYVPLMYGKMKHMEETAESGQALEEGDEDLIDWNPYADDPEAQCVSIAKPGNEFHFLASDPPGFNAEVVLVPKVQSPSSIRGEFQKAELATQVGDIVTGSPYPKSWHAIPAPMSPGSPQSWSALQNAAGYTNGKAVGLYTGKSNAPFTAGYYRVRVKLEQGDCGWEPWRYFWVQIGPDKNMVTELPEGLAGQFGSGVAEVKPRAGAQLADTPARTAGQRTAISGPSLWIDTSRGASMTRPRLNRPASLNVYVRNTGDVPNRGLQQGKVSLSCQPVGHRGGCQRAITSVRIPIMAPGQTTAIPLPSAFRITEPGQYRITLDLTPAGTGAMASGLSRSWTTGITVEAETKRGVVEKVQPRATSGAMQRATDSEDELPRRRTETVRSMDEATTRGMSKGGTENGGEHSSTGASGEFGSRTGHDTTMQRQ